MLLPLPIPCICPSWHHIIGFFYQDCGGSTEAKSKDDDDITTCPPTVLFEAASFCVYLVLALRYKYTTLPDDSSLSLSFVKTDRQTDRQQQACKQVGGIVGPFVGGWVLPVAVWIAAEIHSRLTMQLHKAATVLTNSTAGRQWVKHSSLHSTPLYWGKLNLLHTNIRKYMEQS